MAINFPGLVPSATNTTITQANNDAQKDLFKADKDAWMERKAAEKAAAATEKAAGKK